MSRVTFTLLGSPVHHSASPVIYRAAFRTLGMAATYRARDVGPDALEDALEEAAAGGGGNVTAPHKERVAAALARPMEAVRATGACNCFWPIDGSPTGPERDAVPPGAGRHAPGGAPLLAGDNTDVDGFLAAVAALGLPKGLEGARVVVLGAGGAARAVVYACLSAGVAAVEVRNRTAARAEALVDELASGDPRARAAPWTGREASPRFDLAVNATSWGHPSAGTGGTAYPSVPERARAPEGAGLPSAERLGAAAALDLVYAPGGTAWARRAAARGLPAADGLEMLVQQAARSLQRWLPGLEPPVAEMRAAARRWAGRPEAAARMAPTRGVR